MGCCHEPAGMTLEYVVLGDPVEHSLSPVIQQAAFDFVGFDATYGRRRVDSAGLAAAIDEVRSGSLAGANVTMPHKRLAAELADEVVGPARLIAAANTVWAEGGRVFAATTDPDGVRFAWAHAELPADRPVLVLGSGGAAAAALAGREGHVRNVSARRQHSAEALAVSLGGGIGVIPWGAPVPGAVVVNATPLGMAGESLPQGVLEEASGLLEMTYGTGPTPAARFVAGRGFPVATGEAMLVGQGMASFSIWTGRTLPHDVMLRALPPAESGR